MAIELSQSCRHKLQSTGIVFSHACNTVTKTSRLHPQSLGKLFFWGKLPPKLVGWLVGVEFNAPLDTI